MNTHLKKHWLIFELFLVDGGISSYVLEIAILTGGLTGINELLSEPYLDLIISTIVLFSLASYLLFNRIWVHSSKRGGVTSTIMYTLLTVLIVFVVNIIMHSTIIGGVYTDSNAFDGLAWLITLFLSIGPTLFVTILLLIFNILIYGLAKKS